MAGGDKCARQHVCQSLTPLPTPPLLPSNGCVKRGANGERGGAKGLAIGGFSNTSVPTKTESYTENSKKQNKARIRDEAMLRQDASQAKRDDSSIHASAQSVQHRHTTRIESRQTRIEPGGFYKNYIFKLLNY